MLQFSIHGRADGKIALPEYIIDHALQTHGKRKGLATLCIGGGEATAVALELI